MVCGDRIRITTFGVEKGENILVMVRNSLVKRLWHNGGCCGERRTEVPASDFLLNNTAFSANKPAAVLYVNGHLSLLGPSEAETQEKKRAIIKLLIIC